MPPRKNIIKSGNAGTSSKAQKAPAQVPGPSTSSNAPPPLFPPGSKTPLALLYERCQKNGWEKPDVQTFRQGDGFTGVVKVRKRNPKTSNIDEVRLEPRPPLEMKTANEAKHWVATYALYRFCNNIQLNRVLPEGPRLYWKQLEDEHRAAPDHLKWQYDPDPFVAKVAVEERQKKAAVKRENPPVPEEDDLAVLKRGMEVRMSEGVKDLVETAIKKTIGEFPEISTHESSSLVDDTQLIKSLSSYGFKDANIRSVLEALSSESPFSTTLLSTMSPLEASLEYLLLYTPEFDLPKSFASSTISSAPFVSSVHSGQESLQQRWIEDRAVKEAGYPRRAVKEALKQLEDQLDAAFEFLVSKLAGLSIRDFKSASFDRDARDAAREAEIEAILSVYPNATFNAEIATLSVPLAPSPAIIHFIYLSNHPYPETTCLPTFYISSDSLPAYVRLHITSRVAQSIERYEGEGCCFNAIEAANNIWQDLEEQGLPKPEDVIQRLLPPAKASKTEELMPTKSSQKAPRRRKMDARSSEQVFQEFEHVKSATAYQEMLEQRKKLPAWEYRTQILDAVDKNAVVIMVGETGCGKTTQVPQFILDSEIQKKQGVVTSIIVTQPRRVSVLGVSSRVAAERADDGSVGYAIRGESKIKSVTKLLFCTTGVLLRRLASGDRLLDISHVIVDEVHERSVDSDFLLLELREMLKTNHAPKVILMSATINQNLFSDYFNKAPVVEIPGRTFPVETFYLEDVLPTIQYNPPAVRGGEKFTAEQWQAFRNYFESAGTSSEVIKSLETIHRTNRIDYQLVAAVVTQIIESSDRGAILIFMPGVQEIRQCIEALQAASISKASILPLHANLSSEEQRKVFANTPRRKIVVATNIAETSITIDDVIYVVDGGKMKENTFDPETGLARLKEGLVTQASANQRKGRAGRTQPGKCYRLFTRRDEEQMQNFPIPEMQRVPLESLSLQVKVTRPDEDAKLYLSRALDPPKVEAMQQAWDTLQELGAIDPDGELTALGRQMAMLPLDLRLGKMLIIGTLFGCLDSALTVAACLTSKPIFVSPMEKRDEANLAKMRFSTANSDLLTSLTAFNDCLARQRGSRATGALRSFCEENFISFTAFRDIASLRLEYASALSEIGFIPFGIDPSDVRLNQNTDNINLVKAIIVGGLWPRVVKVVPPKAMFDRIAAGSQQRDHAAKDVKYFDRTDGRVFIHPSSTLFSQTSYKTRFLAYFTKVHTGKIYLRDVTEIPVYGMLLFGGAVRVQHGSGSISIGDWIQLRGTPRIGVLINQLRRLLDAQMQKAIDTVDLNTISNDNPIIEAMLGLLIRDGLDTESL